MKTVQLSQDDRILLGVCGGLAEYFGVDSTLIRMIAIILAFTGAGLLTCPLIALLMKN